MKDKVLDYAMTNPAGVGVYCGTYRKYNNGSLYGMWIDLEKVSDAYEFFEVCKELHSDEEEPEFMFQDYQCFPESLYHESMNYDDIERILEFLELSEDDREIVMDYDQNVEEVDGKDFSDIIEMYCGQWDTFRDFSDELANGNIEIILNDNKDDPGVEFLANHFDYEMYARDLSYEYDYTKEGRVFKRF